MASVISALTSGGGGISMTGDASGILNLNSNGTNVVAVTATGATVTGTLAVSGVTTLTGGFTVGATAAPAFSAYANATQSISQATFTKVIINTELFDTNSNFDSTTNYRFTPTVAGYYQVNGTVRLTGTAIAEIISAVYKNGASYSRGGNISGAVGVSQLTFNEVIYFNGSTDYVELYGYVNAASGQQLVYNAADVTSRFSASMVRSA